MPVRHLLHQTLPQVIGVPAPRLPMPGTGQGQALDLGVGSMSFVLFVLIV